MGDAIEVVLQAVVCAGGAPEGLYEFVPEAIGSVQKVLLRVSCNVRNGLLSNLEVEVRVAKITACNSSQEAGAVVNFANDPPFIDGVIAVRTCRLLYKGDGIWGTRAG